MSFTRKELRAIEAEAKDRGLTLAEFLRDALNLSGPVEIIEIVRGDA